MLYVVLAIFLLTYILLISRKVKGRNIPIWASMVVGAILMIATLSISPLNALASIDFRVITFLFGMLVITAGFEKSGLLEYLVIALLRRAKNVDTLLFAIVFGSGLLSAFLVNDTIALMVTPIVLSAATKIKIRQNKALLLPLAFGITTGSTMSPIGNPQNLLVALNSGIKTPFADFLYYLFIPTILSLLATFYICKYLYRKDLKSAKYAEMKDQLGDPRNAITDMGLAKLSAIILLVLVFCFALIEIVPSLQSNFVSLDTLGFAAGVALLVSSPRRFLVLRSVNWGILVFFAGMFVVMRAVWDSGVGSILLSVMPQPNPATRMESIASIMTSSTLFSQVLSNVPFVQLYSYQLIALGFGSTNVIGWLALAAGSTLAGNLTLLGAVSNVIVIDAAHVRGAQSFSFVQFLRSGIIVTAVTVAICFLFLTIL